MVNRMVRRRQNEVPALQCGNQPWWIIEMRPLMYLVGEKDAEIKY